ncbi:MAG: undecaprenyldiphospho-muramoylpentapeptide beta-N-acetylglucosaminyltransferase [Balneolaceae bacterium]
MTLSSIHISTPEAATGSLRAPRLLVAAGGTGGHVYPGIAIANALCSLKPDAEAHFVGTRDRMEWDAVPKAGYGIDPVWISGFHRHWTWKNLLFPFKLIVSLLQSLQILRRFRPDAVLCCGGFASGPIGWVAARMGIPLFLQEQNSYPGITTRLLAKHATTVFTAFEEARPWLPDVQVRNVGNPVRTGLNELDRSEGCARFGLQEDLTTLLIMGGSGGARTIRDAVLANLEELHDRQGLQILWPCGHAYHTDLAAELDPERWPQLRLVPYIDDMAAAYAASDLVVSRAGAISLSELMVTGKPSILIPSPFVAGDHQMRNAEAMTAHGAAQLLPDLQATERLAQVVQEMLADPDTLKTMGDAAQSLSRPDAAKTIAITLLEQINR